MMNRSDSMDYKAKIFSLKNRLFRPHAVRTYAEISRHENMSPDELYEYGFIQRKLILVYAYENSRFYKEHFDKQGFHPADMKTEDDWNNVPVLTKDDLRNHFDTIRVPDVAGKYGLVMTTGGSTGVPTKVLHDRRCPIDVYGWRTWRWWGVYPGQDVALSWRLLRKTKLSQLLNDVMWFPTRRIFLDASLTTEEDIVHFVEKFNRIRPSLLHGYVGSVTHLAQYCLENDLVIHSPKAISTTSAPLSKPQRAMIEAAFHSPVYDQYGCSEIFHLAAQCRRCEHLHIFTDARHVEFLNESCQVADEGNITITDYYNRVFPFIRYQNGDIGKAVKKKCDCGLPFCLMESVKGRVTDNIVLPGGEIIAGDYLTTIFDGCPDAIHGFQVYQAKDYSITLSVIPNDKYDESESCIVEVTSLLEKKLSGVRLNLKKVDRIPNDRGKTRFVISDAKEHANEHGWFSTGKKS